MKQLINNDLLKKLLKFGLIGFSGLLIDYAVTIIFKEFAGIEKYVANSLGFATAATSNYFLNRLWTFKSNNPKITKEFAGFILIATAGLIINNMIIWLLADKYFSLNFYVSKFIAITIVFIWNFLMNNYFNFKHRVNP